jgi:hypothetical protein
MNVETVMILMIEMIVMIEIVVLIIKMMVLHKKNKKLIKMLIEIDGIVRKMIIEIVRIVRKHSCTLYLQSIHRA